jgi:hypothetical protein
MSSKIIEAYKLIKENAYKKDSFLPNVNPKWPQFNAELFKYHVGLF